MTNGSNDWNVPYSQITWFSSLLDSHGNVEDFERSQDIVFDVKREKQKDSIRIVCLNKYTMGQTMVSRILNEFEGVNIIYIGGNWNGYTSEAKEFCVASNIGIYVSGEISGALWKNEFWSYYKKDEDGNRVMFVREE